MIKLNKLILCALLGASCMQPAYPLSQKQIAYMHKITRYNYIVCSLAIALGNLAGELLGTSFITRFLIGGSISEAIFVYFVRAPWYRLPSQTGGPHFLMQSSEPKKGS